MIRFMMRHLDPGPNHGPRHPMARYRLNKKIRRAVWEALVVSGALPTSAQKLELAKHPVKKVVTFTRFYGGRVREMDHGNFVASCKAVLDALKLGDNGEGLIFDDRPEWVTEFYQQLKSDVYAGMLGVEVGATVGSGEPYSDGSVPHPEPAARRDPGGRKTNRGRRDQNGGVTT